jgi:hypothetical protein
MICQYKEGTGKGSPSEVVSCLPKVHGAKYGLAHSILTRCSKSMIYLD